MLNGLSFEVKQGTRVGVVVQNSGYIPPLFYAFSRIFELESGSIFIDGVDISKVDLHTLRSSVTIIYDWPVIFNGSIKFNIDPAGRIPDQEIESLLLEAGLDDLLKRAPEVVERFDPEFDLNREEIGNGKGIYYRLTSDGN